MTHEELLQEINERLGKCDCSSCNYEYAGFKALRAVVELHTPVIAGDLDVPSCRECSDFLDSSYFFYPCDTIRAIEKELK